MTVKQDGITLVDDQGAAGASTNVNITEVGGSAITKGQKTSAESFPVVIASDQSAVPVTIAAPVTIAQPVVVDQGAPGLDSAPWFVQISDGIDIVQVTLAGELLVNGSGNIQPVEGFVFTQGSIADDNTSPDDPVMIGGTAKDFDGTDPGGVSDEDDVTRAITDNNRRIYVNTTHPMFWSYHEDSSSALTDVTVKTDPGDGFAIFVSDIVVSTGAATAFNIFFEEGANKVLGPYYKAAIGGLSIHFTTPKQITPSTALTVTTSAAIAHSIDITGFVARVS